jgi:hypothetical protein
MGKIEERRIEHTVCIIKRIFASEFLSAAREITNERRNRRIGSGLRLP